MLPTTPLSPRHAQQRTHEPINDLPVHPATRAQLFLPVSESRHFTREDAARAFHPSLLPTDKRIPHPEMVAKEQMRLAGLDALELEEWERVEKARKDQAARRREEAQRRVQQEKIRIVGGRRWDFRFEDIKVEDVGRDGLSRKGVGWRYGAPPDDRKPGQVKIPTSVG
jgi:hypothetical protein